MINALICLLFVLVSCTQFVHCDYTAEIRIFTYSNVKRMHISQGAGSTTYCCCDCASLPTCCSQTRSITCTRDCSTKVLICIADKYCVTSTYSAAQNQSFASFAFGSLANPIFINVPEAYPSDYQVKQLFQFFLFRSVGNTPLIEEFSDDPSVLLDNAKEFINDGVLASLHHNITYRCSDNYYGGACSVYCKAYNDNTNGHYTCNSTGGKTCLPGYTNTSNNCLESIIVCREGCHPTRGYCTVSNECLCNNGWTGTNCNISTTCSSCTNGVCYEPNVCTCKNGWTGSDCSTPVCDPPCNGRGGRCYSPNNCSCYENWSGRLCDIPPGDSSGSGSASGSADDGGSANVAMYVSIINVIINIIIVLLLIGMCVLYFTRKTKQYDLKGSELTKI